MIPSGHSLVGLTVLDFAGFAAGPGKRRIGIPGYLAETDRGAKLLVDTGFDPGHATDHAAADAINGRGEPGEGFPDARDPATAACSALRLFALQTEHDAEILCGHDPAQWVSLPKAPLRYRG